MTRRLLVGIGALAFAGLAQADTVNMADAPAYAPFTLVGDEDAGLVNKRTTIIVYDNIAGSLFSSGASPRRALDDGSFTPGPGAGGGILINSVNFGFVVGTSTAFDILVTYYDHLNTAASPVNSGPLPPSLRIAIPALPAGAYQTGLIDLTGIGGIAMPDDNWAVDIHFVVPGGTTLSTAATHLFAGGPVTVGSSADVYWRDADGNGQYDSSDARTFGGGSFLANFYHQMGMVPAPASLAFVGFGLLCAARRRR